jgi:hypothetical protein
MGILNSSSKNTLSSLLGLSLSSAKLVIKAEHDLPGVKGGRGKRMGRGGQGGEMTQIMYVHVNKKKRI